MSKEKYEPRLTEIEELEKKGIELLPIEEVKTEKLKPNSNNKIFDPLSGKDYDRLKEDIRERGIIDPLICDKSFTLLTGHNRLRIALELGLKEIPVRKIKSELSPKDEEKFLVLDNLLRRQLTAKQKDYLILRFYEKEILEDNRGGDRKSLKKNDGKIKRENSPLIQKESLAKKIEREIGISEATAKKILAKKRKALLPKKANKNKPVKVTQSEPSKKDLQARLKEVKKEITKLQAEEKKLENQIGKMK
jgi:ParB-like chromosome segregation protein Spo0J